MAVVNIKPAVYEDDQGNLYQVGVNAAIYNQEASTGVSILGGPIPAVGFGTLQPLPSSVQPRRAYMKNPAGKGRYVIALTPDGALATTPDAAIDIEDSNNVSTQFTRVGSIRGEKFGRSFNNV